MLICLENIALLKDLGNESLKGDNDLIYKDNNKERLELEQFFIDLPIQELVKTAELGEIETVRKLVAEGVNINAQGLDGMTPLIWTLIKGNRNGVNALLKVGADPDIIKIDKFSG